MARKKGGPTDVVLTAARKAPGGVMRWSEVEALYHSASKDARGGVCMNVGRLLKRYFWRVEGTRGFYVLRETVYNDDREEDLKALEAFHNVFGSDEFGMSTATLAVVPDAMLPPNVRQRIPRMSDIAVAP